jgi:hypothetical protein
MGLLSDALKKLQDAAGATGSAKTKPWGGHEPDKSQYGKAGAPTPDMDSLVTDAEIEQATGSAPVGEPRRNGPEGTDVDLGRHVIRESKLANGDKFLISLGNCYDASAAQLSMDRVAEYEKAYDGVGERGLVLHAQPHPHEQRREDRPGPDRRPAAQGAGSSLALRTD